MAMTPSQALDIRFVCDDLDGDEVTIREYFKRMLLQVFEQGESFSGKRPFGNSGWEGVFVIPLIKAGCIEGNVEVFYEGTEDEYEEAEPADDYEYEKFIGAMIGAL